MGRGRGAVTALVRGDWHDVRAAARGLAKPVASELVDLAGAGGRVLADDLRSLVDLPSADVTAMDGWAAAGDGPWTVLDRIVNGRPPSGPMRPGEARGIGTGAVVPEGTTALVRREHGTVRDGLLHWTGPHGEQPSLGDVRPRGEELRVGDIVLPAGTPLDPVCLAVSAASGHDAVQVSRPPVVDLLVTGDEVVRRGVPAPGTIRDSISPLLTGMTRGAGAAPGQVTLVGDDLPELVRLLRSSAADVVVTTGGTAVGEADHLREALGIVGATLAVDTVAVRPGGPTLLAVLPDGRLVACLPGNPLAAVVGFLAVVHPALQEMTGRRAAAPPSEVLGVDLDPFPRATRVLPFARVDGAAVPTGWSSSSMLRGLSASDGLLVAPREGARTGQSLEVLEPLWRATT
ncbi:molybdopterin molybdenumtransferase MoeA [Aeromicrobium yanjiei]|uniref:Molybdopterin molybdenumtransferase n=1 Tax=Aeromicrobium yanjiei TaxID=2662028 RepID=A0A5Q2MJJ6_9ACTN|nr:molybdopterin molybdenumtransferase MoeA [Aeromicrobium yanjiei]